VKAQTNSQEANMWNFSNVIILIFWKSVHTDLLHVAGKTNKIKIIIIKDKRL